MLAFSVQPDRTTFEAETTFSEIRCNIFLQERQFCNSRLRLKFYIGKIIEYDETDYNVD